MIKFEAICESCNNVFTVSHENVKKNEILVEGSTLWIIYYVCPKCGRKHVVQIDDTETNALLIKVRKQVAKLAVAKKRHDFISDKKIADFDKNRTDLTVLRSDLMKKNNNKDYTEDGVEDKLILSIQWAGDNHE